MGTDAPRNPRQCAKALTARGESVSDVAVRLWSKSWSLPDARFIGHLEQMMGAPWSYLDDATTAWPRKWTREAVADLCGLFSDVSIERLAERVRRELGGPPPRATGR